MTLYRSVGLQELELIYDSGMKAFPARLPQQPIFYPVLDMEYARQIAANWNTKSGQFAGYVTQFKVEEDYTGQFEKHTVGDSQHQEFWIPAERVEEFNQHIRGHIKVVEAHFGDGFQGFIPEKFGMQGKNAVEQFTLLANSYIYNRIDFYLEIKRNHKAVFLNYPFWQEHDFKNPGLKEKILQAIREAWFTSFPKIPLVNPVSKDTTSVEQADSDVLVEPDRGPTPPAKPTDARLLVSTTQEDATPPARPDSRLPANPVPGDIRPVEHTGYPLWVNPLHKASPRVKQEDSLFTRGIKLGLGGKYHEAMDELFKAVEQNPEHVAAHTSLGVASHRTGDDDRALARYEAALKLDPKYAEAHYFRANILYAHGDVREAIAGYTIAIGLQPELIEAHELPTPQDRLTDYTRSPAEMYWIAKPAHRILELNKLLETHIRQANLFKERATAYYRLGNYEQAIADFSASLGIQPEDANVLHSRGLAYEQIGQFDRALEDYQRAITINPQLSDVYINRGITLGKMGNFRQSVTSLSEAIRLAPQNPNGYFNRGMTYFQQGDVERAIDDFSNVIRLSPGDETAYYWRGISNEEAGHEGEAIADYEQFLIVSQDSRLRQEIQQKLRQWNEGQPSSESREETNQLPLEEPDLDLYSLITALGERALNSIWFGSDVDCDGEKAEELYSFTEHNRPIQGRDLLDITVGIRQTIEGDFTAFDPDATSHWLLIRAWHGNGFYLEVNDPKSKARLKSHFQSAEEVEGVYAPYEGLFIRI